jgi:hypothetical protein
VPGSGVWLSILVFFIRVYPCHPWLMFALLFSVVESLSCRENRRGKATSELRRLSSWQRLYRHGVRVVPPPCGSRPSGSARPSVARNVGRSFNLGKKAARNDHLRLPCRPRRLPWQRPSFPPRRRARLRLRSSPHRPIRPPRLTPLGRTVSSLLPWPPRSPIRWPRPLVFPPRLRWLPLLVLLPRMPSQAWRPARMLRPRAAESAGAGGATGKGP